MNISHQTATARSGDVEIFYRRLGQGGKTPLLIVHGLSYFSWDWLNVAGALGGDREVICMDMRGFGDSQWSAKKDYAVPTMGADVIAVLDHARWKSAVLIGHSMGGRSVTYAAAKFQARAAALVLVDYTPENAPAGTQRTTKAVAGTPDAFPTIDEAMTYFGKTDRVRFESYLKKTPQGFVVKRDTHFRDQFRKVLETGERPKLGVDMWQLIGEVRSPILSMRGLRSDMYAVDTKDKMRAASSRLRIAEVDAGHNIAGENPDGFLAALRPFLAELEKSHEHARS
jgi:esterase